MNDTIQQLVHPEMLACRQEVIGRSSIVPAEPGIYAWYFKQPPSPKIQLEKCWQWKGCYLLYIGISPKEPPKNGKPPSSQNLRKRIGYHMRGNAEGSTLRMSIGSLVACSLGFKLRRVGSGKRMTFSDGELVLSDWLEENAYVAWVSHPEPWVVEKEAISGLYLPLNLDQNTHHPFHANLAAARKAAKGAARELPILPK